MIDRYDIQAFQQQAEGQQFDRKSFRIEPKALAVIAVAFANADRGDIVLVEFMREYKLVKEFGEGVDRMFREMSKAGNPAPEYKQMEFMVKVSLLLSLTRRGVEEQIKSLKAKGIIRCVGPDKGGHWEVIEQKEKGGV